MVRLARAVPVLDRKLLRDLWEMKGQSLAIAAVIGAGVAMFVTYLSNFDSLRRTRDAYYESARFADVFASVKRAPASLEPRIAAIPGVEVAATRVVADVTLDVPGLAEPAVGRLISLPERGRPPLNDVYLRRGRWVDAAAARRSHRERSVRRRQRSAAGQSSGRGDQRPPPIADDRGCRALARICVRHQTGRDLPRQAALRHLLDGPPRTRIGVRHGGRLQRRHAEACPRCLFTRGHRRPGPTHRAVRRPRRHFAGAAAVGLDARERTEATPDLRVPRAADLFRGGGVRSECRARAGARAPASADRRAQGLGLLQPRARLALPEVGDGHRPVRRPRRRADRRAAWFGHDWPVQRVLPVPESRLPPVVRRCASPRC